MLGLRDRAAEPRPAAAPLRGHLRPAADLLRRIVTWPPARIAARRARRGLRRTRRRWRRSLQLRIVAVTMLLGMVVVVVLGNFLLVSIRDGLVDSRRATALRQADRLTEEARETFAAGDPKTAADVSQLINDVMGQLDSNGDNSGYGIVLIRAQDNDQQITTGRSSRGVPVSVVPQSLRDEVNRRARFQSQLTNVPAPGGGETPAIAVGSVITASRAGPFELYFVFQLDREQQILDLVRRTFIIGAAALVVLVGAIALVVSRQVVTPVRLAAITAEELASGNFDRRLRVRGEDDLARLARGFNDMAASLEHQIHQLEELSRVQRTFVSDVSHELRTPLTTIRMASEVIFEARTSLDPVLGRTAELLQTQLDRFEELLADLLEISRFDAGAAVLDVEQADLREVVTRVVEILGPLAERKGTVLRVEAPLIGCVAEFDSRRVDRIVRNLVGNAIEHAEGIPIDIQVGVDETAVAVVVRDHGVGLTEAEAQMVFNRFWRADPARARTTGGTGLGLAIALEDAHLHDGWLEAWGSPGLGATFRLTLPRRAGVTLMSSPLPLVPGEQLHEGEAGGRSPAEGPGAGAPTIAQLSTGSIPVIRTSPSAGVGASENGRIP